MLRPRFWNHQLGAGENLPYVEIPNFDNMPAADRAHILNLYRGTDTRHVRQTHMTHADVTHQPMLIRYINHYGSPLDYQGFGLRRTTFIYALGDPNNLFSVIAMVERCVLNALRRLRNVSPQDHVQVFLFDHQRQAWSTRVLAIEALGGMEIAGGQFRQVPGHDADPFANYLMQLLDRLELITNSNVYYRCSEVHVVYYGVSFDRRNVGALSVEQAEDRAKLKKMFFRSLFMVDGKDHYCMERALILGVHDWFARNELESKWSQFYRSQNSPEIKKQIAELRKSVGDIVPQATVECVQAYSKALRLLWPDYFIGIALFTGKTIDHIGSWDEKKEEPHFVISLYYWPAKGKGIGHVDLIKNDSAGLLLETRKTTMSKHYCFKCRKLRYPYRPHECLPWLCQACEHVSCSLNRRNNDSEECLGCGLTVRGFICKLRHGHKCGKFRVKCANCKRIHHPTRTHDCSSPDWCKACKRTCNFRDHRCTITCPKKFPGEVKSLVVYDYETNPEDIHTVELIVAYEVKNMKEFTNGDLRFDPARVFIFTDNDEFCRWVVDRHLPLKSVFLAHNARAYDLHFVLNGLCKIPEVKIVDVIERGSQILQMNIVHVLGPKNGKVVFRDSIQYFQGRLKDFPKAMDIPDLNKGLFPYGICAMKDYSKYEGEVPDLTYFGVHPEEEKCLTSGKQNNLIVSDSRWKDLTELFSWWKQQRDEKVVWKYQLELRKYCIQDVIVLTACINKFRLLFWEISKEKIDVLTKITLPSLVLTLYRSLFMPISSIYILPKDLEKYVRRFVHGGRTETFVMKWVASPDQHGCYVDVRSLYPEVMWGNNYPVGLPIDSDQTGVIPSLPDILDVGVSMIECNVNPPSVWKSTHHRYIPVLPHFSAEGKLLFDNRPKEHFCVTNVELKLALEQGWTVTKVHRVLHWDAKHVSTSLFRSFVETFYRIKVECETTDKPEEMRNSFLKKFGTECGTIKSNKPLRSVAKLILNSLWGKLTQRTDYAQTRIIQVDDIIGMEWFRAFWDRTAYEVDARGDISVLHPHRCWKIQCKREYMDEFIEGHAEYLNNVCPAIGVFVTSYARAHLYKQGLAQLHWSQILYCDTDSVIYYFDKKNSHHRHVRTGDMMGEFANELKPGEVMNEFYSTGAKCYGYQLALNDKIRYVHRVKGIVMGKTLIDTKDGHVTTIGYEDVKKAVLDQAYQVEVKYKGFERKKHKIRTVDVLKTFKNTMDKRVIRLNPKEPNVIRTYPHECVSSSIGSKPD